MTNALSLLSADPGLNWVWLRLGVNLTTLATAAMLLGSCGSWYHPSQTYYRCGLNVWTDRVVTAPGQQNAPPPQHDTVDRKSDPNSMAFDMPPLVRLQILQNAGFLLCSNHRDTSWCKPVSSEIYSGQPHRSLFSTLQGTSAQRRSSYPFFQDHLARGKASLFEQRTAQPFEVWPGVFRCNGCQPSEKAIRTTATGAATGWWLDHPEAPAVRRREPEECRATRRPGPGD